ncbi:hypothetical protein ACXN5S_04390 [Pseudoroseicyclus sp. H15]
MPLARPLFALALLAASPAAAEVTLGAAADAEAPHRTGFETAASAILPGTVWEEDGILVEQVNGIEEGILTELPAEGREGLRSWYPNGADAGYTVISLADGSVMTSVTLLIGNGNFEPRTVRYRMALDGAVVDEGTFEDSGTFARVRFDGREFDALWLRNRATPEDPAPDFGDGTANTLAVDAVEVRVVE